MVSAADGIGYGIDRFCSQWSAFTRNRKGFARSREQYTLVENPKILFANTQILQTAYEISRLLDAYIKNRVKRAIEMFRSQLSYFSLPMKSARESLKSDVCFYEVLGVTSDATTEEIRHEYKIMTLKYHPDKNPNNQDAEQKIRLINQAREV